MRPMQSDGATGADDLHVQHGTEGGDAASPGVPAGVSFKPKKCRVCRKVFKPDRFGKVCCSPHCAIEYIRVRGSEKQSNATKRVRAAEAKEQKAENAVKRQKLMALSKLKNLAQREFNRYIRERDRDLGCISCDAPPTYQGQWAAGHFRTTKAASHLRYNPDNAHKQCGQCNYHKSGNIAEYRPRLIQKIGQARVELLEDDNRTVKWTREELHAIRRDYLAKWHALKAGQ